jgi:Holliday junction DNA helicase RuvA
MIAWLQGVLIEKKINSCVISCHGVGYNVEMVMKDWYVLPDLNEELTLFIAAIFREDSATLYGFLKSSMKEAFLILNTANGVGPKMALQILDTYSVDELSLLIAQGNHIGLTKVKGVGPKLAKRLIIDLKGKLIYQSCPERAMQSPSIQKDALEALIRLGFKENKAIDMIQGSSGNTVEEMIKSSLKKEGA